MNLRALILVVATAATSWTTACGDESTQASYSPDIDPAQFVGVIDHPYLPMVPGTRMTYEGRTDEGLEQIVVEVTRDTKKVMGVTCVVVRDTVTLDGTVIEDTYDWFAQDRNGTVWYFGEETKAFEDGQVSTEGSWEAGVDGALPGIVMKSTLRVGGGPYRQEYYEGEAEDMGEILSLNETATVPFGSYENVVMTKDYTPLEPEVVEHKYYARGVGFVLEVKVKGGDDRIELVKVEQV